MNADKLRQILFRKRLAYRQCFLDDKGELTPAAKVVFADLMQFASMLDPTVVSPTMRQTDVPKTMQNLGRADVLHRCWRLMRLSVNQLYESLPPESEE